MKYLIRAMFTICFLELNYAAYIFESQSFKYIFLAIISGISGIYLMINESGDLK